MEQKEELSSVKVVMATNIQPNNSTYSEPTVARDSAGNLVLYDESAYALMASVAQHNKRVYGEEVGAIAKKRLRSEDYTILQNSSLSDQEAEWFEVCKSGTKAEFKKYVTENKIDINQPANKSLKQYPVHVACRYNNIDVLRSLKEEYSASLTVLSFSKKNCLHYACSGLSADCIKYLLDKGMDPRDKDNNNYDAIKCFPEDIPSEYMVTYISMNKLLGDTVKTLNELDGEEEDEEEEEAGGEEEAGEEEEDDEEVKIIPKKEEKKKDEEIKECVICLTNKPDTLVLPCEHCIVCKGCSSKLQTTKDSKTCLQCRRPITHILD